MSIAKGLHDASTSSCNKILDYTVMPTQDLEPPMIAQTDRQLGRTLNVTKRDRDGAIQRRGFRKVGALLLNGGRRGSRSSWSSRTQASLRSWRLQRGAIARSARPHDRGGVRPITATRPVLPSGNRSVGRHAAQPTVPSLCASISPTSKCTRPRVELAQLGLDTAIASR